MTVLTQINIKDKKLENIREVFDLFVDRSSKACNPSERITLDEMIEKFRGRCPFRQ